MIGLGAGAAGGLALGAAADSNSTITWAPNLGKLIFAPLGAIMGVVIGVAVPSGGWHGVYRAK